jgi:DNA polymerase I-like protein with 3'-5' exonuclease and polymerase domains
MVQLPLFAPKCDWTAPKISELPQWEGAMRVAVDIETRDPELKKTGIGVRRGGYITGVSFAIQRPEDTEADLVRVPAFYLPVRHEGGDNLDATHVFQYLKDQARRFKGDLVGANLQYDLDYLEEAGVEFNPRFIRDVQVAEPILDELHHSFGLEAIAGYNGFEGKDQLHLVAAAKMFGVDPKSEMWKLPARHVGGYAENDARLPLRIINRQERRIYAADGEGTGGPSLWELYNLESRCLPVLLAMRRRGVRIDFDQLDRVEARALREEADSLAEVSRLTGHLVTMADINRPTVVGPAIESVVGKLPRTKMGKIELKAATLNGFKHPAVDALLRAKRFNKVRTTFVESIRRHQVNGRVHTTFNQLRSTDDGSGEDSGAITGRLSSGDPNLQQQPARDPEIGPMWRSIYLPDEGGEWACLDFSQQEPRWLVHFAEAANCRGATEAGERYRRDPKTDNHDMMTIMIHGQEAWDSWDKATRKEKRSKCKTIYLGLCYAMGGGKLARSIDLPTEWRETRAGRAYEAAGPEAQLILDQFDAAVPFIRELARRAEKVAKDRGYIRTILGRRLHFPLALDGSGAYDFTYKALNKLIQGSSADQTKKAMVTAHEAGIRLQLQVHDELDLTIWDRETTRHLSEIMTTCVPCNVPHRCDAEIGPNWGTLKDVA